MNHKTLAILPPRVNIETKGNLETKQAQEMTETVNAQNEIYSRFLDFAQKGKIFLEIQAIEKTNAAFLETGYPYNTPPEELAKVLGVDAILFTDCVFSRKTFHGEWLAYAVLTFPYGTLVSCHI